MQFRLRFKENTHLTLVIKRAVEGAIIKINRNLPHNYSISLIQDKNRYANLVPVTYAHPVDFW